MLTDNEIAQIFAETYRKVIAFQPPHFYTFDGEAWAIDDESPLELFRDFIKALSGTHTGVLKYLAEPKAKKVLDLAKFHLFAHHSKPNGWLIHAVGGFLLDRCRIQKGQATDAATLYRSFVLWSEEHLTQIPEPWEFAWVMKDGFGFPHFFQDEECIWIDVGLKIEGHESRTVH